MRKIGIILSLLLCTMAGLAQNDVKVRFGGQLGFNMSKWSGDYESLYGTKFRVGGNAGVLAEVQVTQKWSIQPELMISMEGTKTDGGTLTFCENSVSGLNPINVKLPDDISAWYIKVPIWVMYSFNVGPGRLSPGLGVYVAWAFTGKAGDNDVTTFSDNSFYRTVYDELQERYSNSPQDFSQQDVDNMQAWYNSIPRRFDYGVGVKCCYELETGAPGLFGSLNVTEGLNGSYNLNLGFSVGYKFKYCKWLRTRYNTGLLEYNP
ncbi:MAG: PorT family protein [Paludibacteraceae bacterium]|nr:PorT family protein [Paludibacteraceae bacterium]MBR6104935.1 PorT family protein [Paludibacteraceae bacterium]